MSSSRLSPKAVIPSFRPPAQTLTDVVPMISGPVPPSAALAQAGREVPSQHDRPTTPTMILTEDDENAGPRILFQPAEEGVVAPPQAVVTEGDGAPDRIDRCGDTSYRDQRQNCENESCRDLGLRRRHPSLNPPSRPISVAGFTAFFRVLFDWIGNFVASSAVADKRCMMCVR